jgi:hypothetical protein
MELTQLSDMILEQLSDEQLAFIMQLSFKAEAIIVARHNAAIDVRKVALTEEAEDLADAIMLVKKVYDNADNNFRKKIIGHVLEHIEETLSTVQLKKSCLQYEYQTPSQFAAKAY